MGQYWSADKHSLEWSIRLGEGSYNERGLKGFDLNERLIVNDGSLVDPNQSPT